MKIIARSFILLFVLLNFVASARNIPVAEERAELISSWMEKNLDLNAEQLTQIEILNLKCEQKIERLTAKMNGFSCMQAVRDSLLQKEDEFKNILTNQQLASYHKFKCELKEKLKKKFKNLN